jgi:low temperature requirement protein LtrA
MSRVRAADIQGVTFVELFFDLVFVYAITQLTRSVLQDLTWTGVGRWVLVFWLIWWAWTQFTWTLNLVDTEIPQIRFLALAGTATAFFLAQAVPDAYGKECGSQSPMSSFGGSGLGARFG